MAPVAMASYCNCWDPFRFGGKALAPLFKLFLYLIVILNPFSSFFSLLFAVYVFSE